MRLSRRTILKAAGTLPLAAGGFGLVALDLGDLDLSLSHEFLAFESKATTNPVSRSERMHDPSRLLPGARA